MRIIGGKYRSKDIPAPKNFKGRPTTNFAKEALFQLLRNRFEFKEIDVLDLFAGSGNISYEFVSMEANSITAVEKNHSYTRFMEKQIERFFPGKMQVITADAYKFIQKAELNYDVVFADPPYDDSNIETLPGLFFANRNRRKACLLIIEHSEETDFTAHKHFEVQRKYGKARFSFFSDSEA